MARLQHSPYVCVFKYARAVKQKVWNEAETGERRYVRVRLARLARVRLLRHALPISLLILRRKPTVLQSMMWQNVILFNLVPSLYSHHKHENTDVSTCEKFKFV